MAVSHQNNKVARLKLEDRMRASAFQLHKLIVVEITFQATTEINPHGHMSIPSLGMNADVLCNNNRRNSLTNNGVPITVSFKNLKKLNSIQIRLNFQYFSKNATLIQAPRWSFEDKDKQIKVYVHSPKHPAGRNSFGKD